MTDVDASQVGGTVGASQPSGVVGASQPSGTVGARLAKPQADLWTPAQLGDDLALWLDWKDSDFDLRTDGGTDYVERWGDLSGNGNDATQSAGSEQPVLDGGVVFDGSRLTSSQDASSERVYFLLVSPNTTNNYTILDGLNTEGANTRDGRHQMGLRGTSFEIFGNQNTVRYAPHNTDPSSHLLEYRSRGQQSKATKDASSSDNKDIGGNGRKGLILGDNYNKNGAYRGSIYIILEGSTELLFEKDKIWGWAAHKADRNGIPEPLANLPADHPHKDEAPRV